MQRLFFALWPDEPLRERIERLLAALPPMGGRRVPAGNFHITVLFMGSMDEAQRVCAESVASGIEADPFELRLDRLGFWPKPQVLWLGASTLPEPLKGLATGLHQGLAGSGLALDERPFQAHMTLMRKVPRAGPLGPIEPIDWWVGQFALIQSITRPEGAVYKVLKTWPLGGG